MNRVVILAGGRGSRMGEHTDVIPKPMVEIGRIPIIEHIMNLWERSLGQCEFIIAAGYKFEVLDKYFDSWDSVYVQYTGDDTQTAGRLKEVDWALDEPFYLCYGDGLTDFDLSQLRLISFRHSSNLVTSTR